MHVIFVPIFLRVASIIKHFSHYWTFVRGIHRLPVDSPLKGRWRGVFDGFFDVPLNKLLSKQWMLSMWRHYNDWFSGNRIAHLREYRWSNPGIDIIWLKTITKHNKARIICIVFIMHCTSPWTLNLFLSLSRDPHLSKCILTPPRKLFSHCCHVSP